MKVKTERWDRKYIVTKGKEGDNILVNHGICGLKDGKNNQGTDAEEHYVN